MVQCRNSIQASASPSRDSQLRNISPRSLISTAAAGKANARSPWAPATRHSANAWRCAACFGRAGGAAPSVSRLSCALRFNANGRDLVPGCFAAALPRPPPLPPLTAVGSGARRSTRRPTPTAAVVAGGASGDGAGMCAAGRGLRAASAWSSAAASASSSKQSPRSAPSAPLTSLPTPQRPSMPPPGSLQLRPFPPLLPQWSPLARLRSSLKGAGASRRTERSSGAARGAIAGSSSSESLTTTRRRMGGWCGCDVRGEGPPPSRGSEGTPPFAWRRATTALVRWSSKSSQSENSSSVRAPPALPPTPRATSARASTAAAAYTPGCAPPGASGICGGCSSSIGAALSSTPSAAGGGAIGQSSASPHTLALPSQSTPSPQPALCTASGTRGRGEDGGGGPASSGRASATS